MMMRKKWQTKWKLDEVGGVAELRDLGLVATLSPSDVASSLTSA